ncbi:hypothetical protein GCM10027261_22930 [Geodermatophilus arenarius]
MPSTSEKKTEVSDTLRHLSVSGCAVMGARPVRAGGAGCLPPPPSCVLSVCGRAGGTARRPAASGGAHDASAKGRISGARSRARSAEVSSGMASAARSASTRAR